MPRRTMHRRFTLSAAVALVAAVAVGFALLRPVVRSLAATPVIFQGRFESAVFHGLLYACPVLLACSLATLGLSLRRPRPPLRQLARRPGFVANAAVPLGVAVVLPPYFGQAALDPTRIPSSYMHVLSTGLPGEIGYFVLGALLPSMLRGDWLPRPTWPDRLGWVIGWLWVLMAVLTYSRLFLYLLP